MNAKDVTHNGNEVEEADYGAVDNAQNEFIAWFKRAFLQNGQNENSPAWSPEQLSYTFQCAMPDTKNPDNQFVIKANGYQNGNVDWYSFDLLEASAINGGVPDYSEYYEEKQKAFIPTPARFKGMPKDRWWEYEDTDTDLISKLNDKKSLTKLTVQEFGLLYSRNWFVFPLKVNIGTLNELESLNVKDVFGQVETLNPAGKADESDPLNKWRMFDLKHAGQLSEEADRRLFVPHTVHKKQESEPIEKVTFLRDEMANMVWGVEVYIPDEMGGGRDGTEAARNLIEALKEDFTPPDNQLNENEADLLHRLSSSIPENWIPFIPYKPDNGDRFNQFRRAVMFRTMPTNQYPVQINEQVQPRTSLLSVGLDQSLPYYINEEEILRPGAILKKTFRRTRGKNGKVITWVGVTRLAGKGEGRSGIRFDQLADKG